MNQVIGPLGAKYLIKYCKEDGQGDAEEDFKQVVMAAHDSVVETKSTEMMTQTAEADFSLLDQEVGGNDKNSNNGGVLAMEAAAPEGEGVELSTFDRVITDEHSQPSNGATLRVMTARNRRGITKGGQYAMVDEAAGVPGEEAENPMWTKESWMGYIKENL